jgi:hypothetical protein
MLVDGLTQERSPEDYFQCLHDKAIQLLVLNIKVGTTIAKGASLATTFCVLVPEGLIIMRC